VSRIADVAAHTFPWHFGLAGGRNPKRRIDFVSSVYLPPRVGNAESSSILVENPPRPPAPAGAAVTPPSRRGRSSPRPPRPPRPPSRPPRPPSRRSPPPRPIGLRGW